MAFKPSTGYVPAQHKVLPFPRGKFFCESKIILRLLPYIGQTAFILRVYLSSIAINNNGKRTVIISANSLAKVLKIGRTTTYRALDVLQMYGLLIKNEHGFELTEVSDSVIEPPGNGLSVLLHTKKPQPRQLYLF